MGARMKQEQQSLISRLKEQRSVRKHLAIAVCLIAILTAFAVFWSLRISGLTLEVETATGTNATETDAGFATLSAYGLSVASEEDEEDEDTTSDDSGTDSSTTTTSSDTSDYYLAATVNADDLTSEDDYIIYTKIDDDYYVVSADGSLVQCTTVSSLSEADGNGPFFVESTGTVAYATSGSDFANYYWNVQETETSGSYYVKNVSTSKYLAPTSAGDTTVVTFVGSDADTISLSGDFKVVYTFMNQSLGTSNWENFVFKISDSSTSAKCLYVRADNYASEFSDSALLTTTNGFTGDITYSGAGTFSWDDWLAAMQEGEAVEVTITRTGTSLQVVMTAADATFKISGTLDSVIDPLTIALTGDSCIITDISRTVYTTSDSGTNYTVDSDNTYAKAVSSSSVYSDNQKAVVFVSESSTSGSGVNNAVGANINYSNLSVSLNSEADNNSGYNAAWESESSAAIFYFAEVQDTADNYHFAETVTLTDAAKNQDDSYVVYTQIGDTYYIVSAVNGSLLECTDISSYSSDDDKVLMSAAAGVYIWSYDETTEEPKFKFTTGSDDSGTDDFEDYRWYVSSEDYDATSGSGTYTLSNEENEDYLAPQLDADTDTLVRTIDGVSSNKSSTSQTFSSGYGTFEYTVTIDGAYSSNGTYYVYFRVYICIPSNTKGRYIRLVTPNVAVGTDWADVADSDWTWVQGNNYTVSSYGVGSMTLNVGDTLTITVVTSDDSIYVNFYNEDTQQTYVRVIDYSGGWSFGTYGTTSYIENIYGDLTVTAVTYGANSSYSYGTSTSISGEGSTTLPDGSLSFIEDSKMTLSGDFDITYAFTNKSNSTALASGADLEMIAAAAADNFAIKLTDGTNSIYVRANNTGYVTTTSGGTETETSTSTFYTYASLSDDDRSTFAAAMQSGATCTVRVVRTGNNFTFIMTVTPTNATNYPDSYTLTASVDVSEFEDGSTVYAYLGGENCTISSATYTDNTARERNNTKYHRVSDVTEEIEIKSTSSSSYYKWTAAATGYYSEKFVLIGQLATDTAGTAEIEWVEDTYATGGVAATGTATLTLDNATASTLSNTVVLTFSLARVSTYFVWFDGTNGGMASYSANSSAAPYDEVMEIPCDAYGNLTSITTPSGITDASGYGLHSSDYGYYYTLRGWYDIYNGKYYEPDADVTLTASTVMYADWAVNTYDIAQERSSNLAKTVSTNSFITTHLFDYNDDYDKIALN